jgi:hypothetical protein
MLDLSLTPAVKEQRPPIRGQGDLEQEVSVDVAVKVIRTRMATLQLGDKHWAREYFRGLPEKVRTELMQNYIRDYRALFFSA